MLQIRSVKPEVAEQNSIQIWPLATRCWHCSGGLLFSVEEENVQFCKTFTGGERAGERQSVCEGKIN